MADFLLVHGSGFGAWCWPWLTEALTGYGHSARAIDLPRGPGISLKDQARAICDSLTGPTLLVGHSAGGFPITAAAETDPEKIQALIWLCGYIPGNGSSVASRRRSQSEQPLRAALKTDRASGSYSFAPESLTPLFFHDCPPETRALAARQMAPESIAPQETPLRLTARSQNLPRFAITCENDRAIPPAFQHAMAGAVPPGHRFSLACGHAPFFARPQETAALLHRITGLIP
ncbi:alpha/beta fold hydrolase [Pseudomonas sp. GX19020]|uniref:alpha/beta fold hydrolase n=1 Tax=Pseudomonas sp. GX19020 TaxID=2942277 RepID=UPI002018BADF|nr:alpha/beta fold hydrolase [Pseudomonas sp. GX19020]MCL4067300.1 alpha/beta fold hydrolase [Pseudomonas sp. GX19020]